MTAPWRPPAWSLVWLLTGCLACALLLAQALGLMHGVVHAAGDEHHLQATKSNHNHGHAHSDENRVGGGWLEALFSSHDGGADCRLFDQASHGSAAPALALASLPTLLPSLAVAIFQGEALARWAALFDARGPPLIA